MKRLLLSLLLVGILVQCSLGVNREPLDFVSYDIIEAYEFQAPDLYHTVWKLTVGCLEYATGEEFTHRAFEDVRWFYADSIIQVTTGNRMAGVWSPPNRVYLDKQHLDSSALVQHELLHYILAPISHDDILFQACDPFHRED